MSEPGIEPEADGDATRSEFDAMAAWTADAVRDLGPQVAIPATCRGSGSPAALDWLAGVLDLGPGVRLVDSGAGAGGPGALAAARWGVAPTLIEPMAGAATTARSLFGMSIAVAAGTALPLREAAFPVGWCLGVLCLDLDRVAILRELHRVLAPGGSLGLLVFVRLADALPEEPDGNSFPSAAELDDDVAAAGFTIVAEARLDDLAPAPEGWEEQVKQVERHIEAAHGEDVRWREAARNERIIGRLVDGGHVVGRLMHLVAEPPRP